MLTKHLQLLIYCLFTYCNLFAQVINDNIEDRITLYLNEPVASKTDSCTLQQNCLNKEIEHKCIKYHNDQWFEFSVKERKSYFINISKQNCRDIDGVQLVIIDGRPCQPETYKSLGCVSLGNQDDIFLEIDSLIINHNYLILVDGYLEDYCSFEIELSDQPKGVPARFPKKKLVHESNKQTVKFDWHAADSLVHNAEKYLIYRREAREHKSKIIGTKPHQKDAYGNHIMNYNHTDTLHHSGTFHYQVFLDYVSGKTHYLGEFSFDFDLEKVKNKYSKNHITISRTYKRPTEIEIAITDAYTDKLILRQQYGKSRDHQLFLNIKTALDEGTTKFLVTIKDLRKNRKERFEIDWLQYLKP